MSNILIKNIKAATMTLGHESYGLIEGAAVVIEDSKISWAGKECDLPPIAFDTFIDGQGGCLTPGLIDCHTHIVYGGNRAREFEQRLKGVSYEEIARRGGGIVSTVCATRLASEQELYHSARKRLNSLIQEGVTTIEIKSGYGLNTETELKMLKVVDQLGADLPVDVVKTFLGAHAVPPEYEGKADDYIEMICREMIPAVAETVDMVDVFTEKIAFNLEQTRKVFDCARKHGLKIKIHAEQLSNMGAAKLGASYGALSAEHLEYIDEASVQAMGKCGMVAVLLPGAFYFLREKQLPPIDLFRKHRVPIAISTDSNPGSSPASSLLLMLNMACNIFGMIPEEALTGVTRNAAQALGLGNVIGTIEPGKQADLVLWDIQHPAELAYHIGYNPCRTIIKSGSISHTRY